MRVSEPGSEEEVVIVLQHKSKSVITIVPWSYVNRYYTRDKSRCVIRHLPSVHGKHTQSVPRLLFANGEVNVAKIAEYVVGRMSSDCDTSTLKRRPIFP